MDSGTIHLSISETPAISGAIKLSRVEPEQASGTISLTPLEIEELYNHNHGRGGLFTSGKESSGSNESNGVYKATTTDSRKTRASIKEKVSGSKDTSTLHKAEADLEDLKSRLEGEYNTAAADKNHKKAREITKEFTKARKDLHDVRSKIYNPQDFKRIEEADSYATEVRQAAEQYKRSGSSPTGLLKSIIEDGGKWADDELIRAKQEARGIKVPRPEQKIGTLNGKKLTSNEWPDLAGLKNSADSTRPIKVIAEAGFARKKLVDGLKVKRASEITAKDGTKLRMYDMAGGGTGKKTEEMLNSLAVMHELYPMRPPRSLVLLSGAQTFGMAGANAQAAVIAGPSYIFMNKQQVSRMGHSHPGWFMKTKDVPGTHYVLTHEYGHQFDFTNKRSSARGLYENKNIKNSLSVYGKANPHEAYAEAFAAWHTSQGKTTNPAAIAYARHEKWHGYDSNHKVVADIGSDSLIFLSKEIEEWDPWILAKELGIISLAADDIDDGDDELKDFPKDFPMIIENWDTGKPEARNFPDIAASEQEKKDAEDVARQVWEELGLTWE